jgi:hypothetical protein
MSNWKETEKFLDKYGKSVVNEQKTRLKGFGKGGSHSGSLEKSLSYKKFDRKGEVGVDFYMNEYGNYVDKGVQGYKTGTTGKAGGKSIYKYKNKDKSHKPRGKSKFIESLMKWCGRKGIPKGAAFPIRRKIWQEGIERTLFFTIPIQRSDKRFKEGIEKSMKLDIENNIQAKI